MSTYWAIKRERTKVHFPPLFSSSSSSPPPIALYPKEYPAITLCFFRHLGPRVFRVTIGKGKQAEMSPKMGEEGEEEEHFLSNNVCVEWIGCSLCHEMFLHFSNTNFWPRTPTQTRESSCTACKKKKREINRKRIIGCIHNKILKNGCGDEIIVVWPGSRACHQAVLQSAYIPT